MDSYIAQAMMPVPIKFDSLVSYLGENGDQVMGTVENEAYYILEPDRSRYSNSNYSGTGNISATAGSRTWSSISRRL